MPRAAVTDGIELEYEVFGEGPPLYLIMGLNTQMVAWPRELIDELVERGYQVVRMDNRDIGLSSKTQAPVPNRKDVLKSVVRPSKAKADYLIEHMAADIAGLMDHLGHDKVHLVGASMGGMIAQQIAIDHPDRVASLCSIMSTTGRKTVGRIHPSLLRKLPSTILAEPPKDRAGAVARSLRTWRMISGPHFDEKRIRETVELALDRSTDTVGGVRQMIAIGASPDRTTALRRVHCPTLVIHGMRDKLVMPSGGLATARAIRHSRLLMFPDMAHDLPAPRLSEIADAIDRNARRA
ncbi:MAG: alpha/beta fold hydrolase [Dermatophilaceae bacterium]|nr:alpha/beta fold hydrolase [Intrasporangiaceae bacterium]